MAAWTAEARRTYHAAHPENFAGPAMSFPIKDGDDVQHAWADAYRPGVGSPSQVRRRIKEIAKRLRLTVHLPSDAYDSKEAAVAGIPFSTGLMLDLDIAEAHVASGPVPVMVIAAGKSKGVNGPIYYGAAALTKEAAKFDGVKVFDNHLSDREEKEKPYRSIFEHLATIKETAFDPTPRPRAPSGGVVGKMHFHDARFESRVRDHPDTVSLSIRALGRGNKQVVDGETLPCLESFTRVVSCDAVTEAGAGGGILSIKEAADKERDVLLDEVKAEDILTHPTLGAAVRLALKEASRVVGSRSYEEESGPDAAKFYKKMAKARADGDRDAHDKLLDNIPAGVTHLRDDCHMCRGDMESKESAVANETPAGVTAQTQETPQWAISMKESFDSGQKAIADALAEIKRERVGAQRDLLIEAKVSQSGLPEKERGFLLADLKESAAMDALPADTAKLESFIDAKAQRVRTLLGIQDGTGAPRPTGLGGGTIDAKEARGKAINKALDKKFGAGPAKQAVPGVQDARGTDEGKAE